MAIGMRMRPLAIENRPEGYIKCDYLESTGSQRMVLPVNDEPTDEIEVQTVGAFTDISGGVEGKTGSTIMSFFWGISGNLYAGCGNYTTSSVKPDMEWHTFILRKSKAQSAFIVDEKVLLNFSFPEISMLKQIGYGLWRLANAGNYPAQKSRKSSVKFIQNGKLIYDLAPALDPTGAPCMFDLITQTPFYNENTSGPDFLYKAYSYPFNPGNNWHTVNKKIKEIVGSTKYTLELIEDGE